MKEVSMFEWVYNYMLYFGAMIDEAYAKYDEQFSGDATKWEELDDTAVVV